MLKMLEIGAEQRFDFKISFLGRKRSGANQSKQWVILLISPISLPFNIVLVRWKVPNNNYSYWMWTGSVVSGAKQTKHWVISTLDNDPSAQLSPQEIYKKYL